MAELKEIFIRFTSNARSFSKQMAMPQEAFSKLYNNSGQLRKEFMKNISVGQRLAIRIRHLTQGMRGFRMEMLSVMFGGQMMAGAMWGLLKPALEVTGVFDLLTAALQIFFLPIALFLLENVFLPLFNWFTNLPEPIKIFVGALVVVVGVIGTLLAVGAALVLFIGGLIMAWGVLNLIFVAIPIGWIILLIVALIAVIVLLWKNWDKIWGWIKEKAGAVWDWLVEKLHLDAVWEKLKEVTSSAWKWIFDNVWKPVKDWFYEWVINPLKTAWDWLIGVIQSGWDKVKSIWEGIKSAPGKVWEKTKSLFSNQSGGYVPHTGMYKLHAGESVSQAGTNNFMPNIVVNASSNVDIEMLKSQLSYGWANDLARLSRR